MKCFLSDVLNAYSWNFLQVVGKEDDVISDADLYQLLDRSELVEQWEEQKLVNKTGTRVIVVIVST